MNRLKGIIRKYKRVLGTTVMVIGFVSSIIGVFAFLTGIQSCPDALKKLWYDSAKDSEPSAKFYTVKLLLPARMSGAEVPKAVDPALRYLVRDCESA